MSGITGQDVMVLSRALDVPIDDADLDEVARRLEDMLALLGELDSLDLSGRAPDTSFDPAWPNR